MIDPNRFDSVGQFYSEASRAYADKPYMQIKLSFRRTVYTYHEIFDHALRLATYLGECGLKKGDRVIVMGPNAPQYGVSVIACALLGATTVPSDMRTNEETLEKYVEQTKPKLAIKSRIIRQEIPCEKTIFFEDIFELTPFYAPLEKFPDVGRDDIMEILFTSGTTGDPKGVMISHGNYLSNLAGVINLVPKLPRYETISLLPLSHVFEQVAGLGLMTMIGGKIIYLPKVNSVALQKELYYSKCTHIMMVPQLMKTIMASIEKKARDAGKEDLFNTLLRISSYLPFSWRRKLFKRVHENFGGHINFFACGGASLDMDSAKKWELMGVRIIEGYGATEVTAVATCPRTVDERILGSIGAPLPGVEVKLGDEDEILIKGPNVTQGYYNNKEKTDEVFKDGWYHTGDIGRFDKKGNLYFVGRMAFKIVLSNGENVYVEDIERTINEHPLIKDSCVIALERDGKEVIYASLLTEKPDADLDKIVQEFNERLEEKQRIMYYGRWEDEDFPRTRTLKTNRKLVAKMLKEAESGHASTQITPAIEETDDRLIEIISTITQVPSSKINDRSKVGVDLKLDSLDRAEAIAQLEDEFEIDVGDFEIQAHTTISDLRKLIEERTAFPVGADRMKRHYFKRSYQFLKLLLQDLFFIPYHRNFIGLNVLGQENLKLIKGPAIIVWNHVGVHDTICCLRLLPRELRRKLAVAAAKKLWEGDHSYYGKLIEYGGGGIRLSQDGGQANKTFNAIGYLLDEGWIVMISPEGKFQRGGEVNQFKKGVAYLSSLMQVPVIPMKISENYNDLCPSPPLHGATIQDFLLKNKGKVSIRIGKPIHMPAGISPAAASIFLRDTMQKM